MGSIFIEPKQRKVHNIYKNMQYVDFDLSDRVCVVASAMGTGKTHLITKHIDLWYASFEKIVVLSTRLSFARGLLTRRFDRSKIVIVQVDSLEKLTRDTDVAKTCFILDEFESVLQRSYFVGGIGMFVLIANIVRYAPKVVIADACIAPDTRKVLNRITEYTVYYNAYKPYRGNIVDIVDFSNLKKTVRRLSKDSKKIIGIVYSVGCANKIRRYLSKYNYNVLTICSEQHKEYNSSTNTDSN
jgi:hypothetical protein